jgi:DNA-binding transcriptional MocR family regulator
MNMRLSDYGQASTHPSPVNRMMVDFAGDFRDGVDINLGVGYVNEKTIPLASLMEAMQAVTGDPVRYRQAFNYGSPGGSANLVAALRRFLVRMRVGGLDEAAVARLRLIIGPCGATSLLDGLAEVIAPGIIVTSDPMYYIYSDALLRKGFEVLAVPEDEEGIELAALARKLRSLGDAAGKIAFFYVVTVNNPSCTILSNRRRRALLQTVAALSRRLGRPVPIFYDLAYELLLHDPLAEPFVSVLPEDDLGIAYEIGTLSKVLAPGLRLGYLLGPDGPLMNAMVQKTSDSGFSAPLFVQEMASYLLGPPYCGPVARRQCGIPREGPAGSRGHRSESRALSGGVPWWKCGLLLLPHLPGCRDSPVFTLLPVSHAHHGRSGGGWPGGRPLAACDLHPG